MIGSRFRFLHIGVVIILLTALLPLVATNEAQGQAGNEIQIQITANGFQPAELTVPIGSSLRWVNVDTEAHTLISLDGEFEPFVLEPGDSRPIGVDVVGTFSFQLDDEAGPQGTIEVTGGVRDLDQDPAAPDATPAAPVLPDVPDTEAGPALNLAPAETPRLAHIHAGTCDELGIVVYSFADPQSYLIEPASENRGPTEVLVGTAGVALPDLFTEPFSIHVHQDAQNKQNYIACADIGGQPEAPWTEADGLVLELAEHPGSGMAGFASLRPAADGGTDVSLFLSGPAGAEAATVDPNTTPPTTYTSPTYGYSLSYNNAWDVTQETSDDGRDLLVLTNGTSFISFTGAPDEFNGDPADCVSNFLQERTADPNAFNVEVALGPDGEPLVGGTEATGAFVVFNHDYRLSTGVVPYTLFVACVPLIPGEAVLSVVQNVPAADFESQVALREALLRGLVLNQ